VLEQRKRVWRLRHVTKGMRILTSRGIDVVCSEMRARAKICKWSSPNALNIDSFDLTAGYLVTSHLRTRTSVLSPD